MEKQIDRQINRQIDDRQIDKSILGREKQEGRHRGEKEEDMTYSESGKDSELPGSETKDKIDRMGQMAQTLKYH